MTSFSRLCVLIPLLVIPSVFFAQKGPPQQLYTVDVSSLVPREPRMYLTGSLTFLTDHSLAASVCSDEVCNLETVDFADGKPRQVARTDEFRYYSDLFRAPNGSVILDHVRNEATQGSVLVGNDLRTFQLISKAKISQSHISASGATFIDQFDRNDWTAYKMSRPPVRIRAGTGQVLCVSDEAVAYIEHGTIRVEAMDGKVLGHFAAELPSKGVPRVNFFGLGRLWFDSWPHPQLRDFDGRTVQVFDKPEGWGVRVGQSSDGRRLLYDRYTRHIPLAQSIEETATAVATLGLGVGDESANGEMVRVIDVAEGRQCFEWYAKAGILLAGGYHADISPSGHLVAVLTQTTLSIYKLPEVCTGPVRAHVRDSQKPK